MQEEVKLKEKNTSLTLDTKNTELWITRKIKAAASYDWVKGNSCRGTS